jgi:hypothetical protein
MLSAVQPGMYPADDEAMRVMDRLIEACPSFSLDEINIDLPWCAAGQMGQHLTELIDEGRGGEAAQTLSEVEAIFQEYEPNSRAVNLLTVGLMEGVSPERDDFSELLGPESRRWWNGLNAYMGGLHPKLEPLDRYPGADSPD